MTLTQKHFTAIAEIIRTEREEAKAHHERAEGETVGTVFANGKLHETELIANRLANYFATANANFKRRKFLDACGV